MSVRRKNHVVLHPLPPASTAVHGPRPAPRSLANLPPVRAAPRALRLLWTDLGETQDVTEHQAETSQCVDTLRQPWGGNKSISHLQSWLFARTSDSAAQALYGSWCGHIHPPPNLKSFSLSTTPTLLALSSCPHRRAGIIQHTLCSPTSYLQQCELSSLQPALEAICGFLL